jgi:GR25 family glycosyltransferase involved in LPS biosynthesis
MVLCSTVGYVIMGTYFDDYFDMVYFINLPHRTDRYESIMNMFELVGIHNYKRITPIDSTHLHSTYVLSNSGLSCKLAHMECVNDAILNNYDNICIFEDDAILNQSYPTIVDNLEYHLQSCFDFLKNNEWDIFYFDNIAIMRKDSKNETTEIIRLPKTDKVTEVKHKRFAHSYALSKSVFKRLVEFQTDSFHRNDYGLDNLPNTKRFYYSYGIFDQILNNKSDNIW